MKRLLLLSLLVTLLILPALPAHADQGDDEGALIIGRRYVLESDEVLRGDLVVIRGTAFLEEGSLVTGDVASFMSDLTVAGRVAGSAAVFGGKARLTGSAVIDGDLVSFGSVDRERGATVRGESVSPGRFYRGPREFQPFSLGGVQLRTEGGLLDLFIRFVRTVLTILALMALALLVVAFFPEQVERTALVAYQAPAPSFGVGCLAILLLPFVCLLLVFTIIGIPLALILAFGVGLAGLFGWVAVGLLVGQKILDALKAQEVAPLLAALVGVFLLSVLAAAPSCIGPLVVLSVGSLALGAVILSRFGTQLYPPVPVPASPPAPSPPPGAEIVVEEEAPPQAEVTTKEEPTD